MRCRPLSLLCSRSCLPAQAQAQPVSRRAQVTGGHSPYCACVVRGGGGVWRGGVTNKRRLFTLYPSARRGCHPAPGVVVAGLRRMTVWVWRAVVAASSCSAVVRGCVCGERTGASSVCRKYRRPWGFSAQCCIIYYFIMYY